MKLSPSTLRHLAAYKQRSAPTLPEGEPEVSSFVVPPADTYPDDFPKWANPHFMLPWKPFGKAFYHIPISDGQGGLSFVIILREAGKPLIVTRHEMTIYAWPHGCKFLAAATMFTPTLSTRLTPPFMFHDLPKARKVMHAFLESLTK